MIRVRPWSMRKRITVLTIALIVLAVCASIAFADGQSTTITSNRKLVAMSVISPNKLHWCTTVEDIFRERSSEARGVRFLSRQRLLTAYDEADLADIIAMTVVYAMADQLQIEAQKLYRSLQQKGCPLE